MPTYMYWDDVLVIFPLLFFIFALLSSIYIPNIYEWCVEQKKLKNGFIPLYMYDPLERKKHAYPQMNPPKWTNMEGKNFFTSNKYNDNVTFQHNLPSAYSIVQNEQQSIQQQQLELLNRNQQQQLLNSNQQQQQLELLNRNQQQQQRELLMKNQEEMNLEEKVRYWNNRRMAQDQNIPQQQLEQERKLFNLTQNQLLNIATPQQQQEISQIQQFLSQQKEQQRQQQLTRPNDMYQQTPLYNDVNKANHQIIDLSQQQQQQQQPSSYRRQTPTGGIASMVGQSLM
ncbi:hypothetical protein SNEBB_005798 [Seison nebaliae]|nr:hypothetical protein SNEBB_005798 [Seison nebaliae]